MRVRAFIVGVPIDIFGPIFSAFCASTFELFRDTIQARRERREQQQDRTAVTAPPTTWLPAAVGPRNETRPVVVVAAPPVRSGHGVALLDQIAAALRKG